MIDYADVATSYIAMWNATDEQDRAKLVAALCADDARYIDPLVGAEGSEAIAETIAGAQQQFPGWTFRLAGPSTGTTTRRASPGSSARKASTRRSSASTSRCSPTRARSSPSTDSSTRCRQRFSLNPWTPLVG